MNQIPLLGWVAIGVIVVITLLINLALVLMLRNPSQLRNLKMPRNQQSGVDLKKTVDTMRDPFRSEREQWKELANLVHGLESSHSEETTGHEHPPEEAQKKD